MLSPMPPSPMTSTVAPGSTRAVLNTAPTPVCTAQPITHATSSGTSLSILTAPDACVSTYSPKAPSPTPRKITSPPRDSPVEPSANELVVIAFALTHTPGSPRTQK